MADIGRCIIPGCRVTEPGVGENTCVIWSNRRLCYPHFAQWGAWQLAHGDRPPTDAEWKEFASGVARSAIGMAAVRGVAT